jgi:hypothetical protein
MTGLWVGLASRATLDAVRAALESWFPDCRVGEFDALIEAPPGTPWPPIVVGLHENASEFPILIDLTVFPGPQDEAVVLPVMIELARRFAAAFGCRTICDGSGHGDDRSPYWSIVWDGDRAYLADDAGTAFADGEGGEVAIVRELRLPRVTLDAAGHLA